MEYLVAVVLFAVTSSATPGPNNLMVMTSGLNFGVKKSLPLLTGICVGFFVMLLVVGLGFGQLFDRFPDLHFWIKCVGTIYLLYLAWLIARSGDISDSAGESRPLTFMKGALFQWVNAKAWVVATGAIAAFTSTGGDFYSQHFIICVTFLFVSFPGVGIWLLFGSLIRKVLSTSKYRIGFNYFMALLLALSVVPVLQDIFHSIAIRQ
ncbi:LysE family translocator [Veronia pacifica]|uniref:Lysine transporter LysE n=1 Tax=Veronia pacifica TaxID=1080227 RepID=A0A1C3ECY5_9GAMM|nr:LysE family translocator [Veronia pacifica]ODA31116.1 lysine transporter LysE [Veronia pacifica]